MPANNLQAGTWIQRARKLPKTGGGRMARAHGGLAISELRRIDEVLDAAIVADGRDAGVRHSRNASLDVVDESKQLHTSADGEQQAIE